jgi:hypothetical protein
LLALVAEIRQNDQAGHWHEFLSQSKWHGPKWKSIRNLYLIKKSNHLIGSELRKKKKDFEQLRLSGSKSAPNEQYSSPEEKANHAQALQEANSFTLNPNGNTNQDA